MAEVAPRDRDWMATALALARRGVMGPRPIHASVVCWSAMGLFCPPVGMNRRDTPMLKPMPFNACPTAKRQREPQHM